MEENNPFNFLINKRQNLYKQFTESWKHYHTDFIYANDKLRTGIKKFGEAVENRKKEREPLDTLIEENILPKDKDIIDVLRIRNAFEYQSVCVKLKDIERYKKVMNIVYKALYQYYQKEQPKDKLDYNYFPIANYQILSFQEKEFLGKQQKEYLAIRKNEYGEKQECIIREYSKKGQKLLFNHEETVGWLLEDDISPKAKNLMQMKEIETKQSHPYRYIAYLKDKDMRKLSEISLETLTNKDKILLLRDIINGVYELGNLTKYPINHRNITPENIYVTKRQGRYLAKLGNFEFSKIIMNKEEYQSAYHYINKQYKKEEKFCCYYPKTGWENARTYEDWEKVDVFSLGKIIEYICFGQVVSHKYQVESFKEKGYPVKLGELYSKMVNLLADRRPTIKQAREEMKKIRGGIGIWIKKIG